MNNTIQKMSADHSNGVGLSYSELWFQYPLRISRPRCPVLSRKVDPPLPARPEKKGRRVERNIHESPTLHTQTCLVTSPVPPFPIHVPSSHSSLVSHVVYHAHKPLACAEKASPIPHPRQKISKISYFSYVHNFTSAPKRLFSSPPLSSCPSPAWSCHGQHPNAKKGSSLHQVPS